MKVKPTTETIALNVKALSNKNNVINVPLDKSKSASESSSVYISRQYMTKWNSFGHTNKHTLFNVRLNAPNIYFC